MPVQGTLSNNGKRGAKQRAALSCPLRAPSNIWIQDAASGSSPN
jgi:hypothetical protein